VDDARIMGGPPRRAPLERADVAPSSRGRVVKLFRRERRLVLLSVLAALLLGSCSRTSYENSGVPPAPRDTDTTATAPTPPLQRTRWIATFTGVGGVRAGMTVAEAEQALGTTLVARGGATGNCSYVFVEGRTELALMVIDGRIARADIQEGPLPTTEGARIGDSEERIRTLYHHRVEVQPHKYTDGHYLIVRPEGAAPDSNYRIIFETDGQKVLRYRTGRMPEVRWVEGCS
jgi:hypothetical protein